MNAQLVLAMKRAHTVLRLRLRDRHATVLSSDRLQELAASYGVELKIHSTHVYDDYTSIVYEIL